MCNTYTEKSSTRDRNSREHMAGLFKKGDCEPRVSCNKLNKNSETYTGAIDVAGPIEDLRNEVMSNENMNNLPRSADMTGNGVAAHLENE